MPTNDPEYMRAYQKRRREEKKHDVVSPVEKLPEHVTENSHIEAEKIPEKPLEKKSRFNCGCQGKMLCMSHAIQKVPQKLIDEWLDKSNWCKKHPMREQP
jgi:hypothetical protein